MNFQQKRMKKSAWNAASRESLSVINHVNRARCSISQFRIRSHMVMPLISELYFDIHRCVYILYAAAAPYLKQRTYRQSGRLQPCTIDYLLTINWLVLIVAFASLQFRVIATSFRAIIKKSSRQFGRNNCLQSSVTQIESRSKSALRDVTEL